VDVRRLPRRSLAEAGWAFDVRPSYGRDVQTQVIASANNLSVKYGTQVVLDGATIAFTEGEHIGLSVATARANRPFSRSRRAWRKPIQGNHTPA